jgi:hypothetical protein
MTNADIQWVEDGDPDERPFRSFVIGWQNSRFAINLFIQSYNELTLRNTKPNAKEELNIAAVRRHILSSLLELKGKLDSKFGQFRREKIDTASIEAIRKARRGDLERAEGWRDIRNLTFHFGDVVEDDAQLVATYKSVFAVTDAEVNTVWEAIVEVGEAMKMLSLERC